jgi:hypothetical protein
LISMFSNAGFSACSQVRAPFLACAAERDGKPT